MTRSTRGSPVLLHGFAGSASEWDGPVVDGLAGSGLAPVSIDLPGHGADTVVSDPAALTLASALARIEAAGRWPADLVGYSMGGRLALHYAVAHPDRVRRLVLESASPGLERESERAERRASDEALAARIESEGVAWFVDHWESRPMFESRRRLDADMLHRRRTLRLRNDPRSLAAALRGLGTAALPSLWDRLEQLDLPTLLVVGERDEKFVAIAERMARTMPRARIAVIPGAGHTVHLEAPAAWLKAVIGFLGDGAA